MPNNNLSSLEIWKNLKDFQAQSSIEEGHGIDLKELSKRIGIEDIIQTDKFNELTLGAITKGEDGKYYIVVNNKQNEKRKRFTIAHEIGHFILHREILDKNKTILDKVSEGDSVIGGPDMNFLLRAMNTEGVTVTNKHEIEANKMAADILMPFDKINGMEEHNKKDVSFFADYFNVSLTAMAIRLEKSSHQDWFNQDYFLRR